MRIPSLLLAAGLAVAPAFQPSALCADTAAAKTYTVSFNPAWKVGEKFGVTSNPVSEMHVVATMAPPGQPAQTVQDQTQKKSAHFEADAEVLAVFPNGGLQKAAFTVKTFTGTASAAAEKELLPAGAKIVADKTGTSEKKTFTVDGQPAPAEVAKFLSDAVDLDSANHTDQDVFGSEAPMAVGGTWPINGTLLIESGLKKSFGADLTCQGTMKLDAITGEGATQVATVSGTMVFDHVKAPLPPMLETKVAEVTGELAGSQPATHKGARSQKMKMKVKFVAEGVNNGAQMSATMEMTQQNKSELTYR
jgi:hypothetical protein